MPRPTSAAALRAFRRDRLTHAVCVAVVAFAGLSPPLISAAEPSLETFRREIQPLLAKHCYDCHGDGTAKGGVTLDTFELGASLRDPKLWSRALKNVRTGIMPPAEEGLLPPAESAKLMEWIKREGLGLDPTRPDPGRVTVRRLNRTEYRNTIRDLIGVEFDTQKEFPADDTGHGFDNIADVLTISPMLLEKYLDAALAIAIPGLVANAATQSDRSGRRQGPWYLRRFQRPPGQRVAPTKSAAHGGP